MKKEPTLLTQDNLNCLRHPTERGLALVLLAIPHLIVYYEPCVFSGKYKDKGSKFCPDFLIVNTKAGGRGRYVEIINTNGSNEHHPKERQRAIISQTGENCLFLLKKHLMNIARAHPEVDFGYSENQLSHI